jgi:hypothetical protein
MVCRDNGWGVESSSFGTAKKFAAVLPLDGNQPALPRSWQFRGNSRAQLRTKTISFGGAATWRASAGEMAAPGRML